MAINFSNRFFENLNLCRSFVLVANYFMVDGELVSFVTSREHACVMWCQLFCFAENMHCVFTSTAILTRFSTHTANKKEYRLLSNKHIFNRFALSHRHSHKLKIKKSIVLIQITIRMMQKQRTTNVIDIANKNQQQKIAK